MPDGTKKQDREDYILVPEHMLRVAGTGIHHGDLSGVRKRLPLDQRKWPFTPDAAEVLLIEPEE